MSFFNQGWSRALLGALALSSASSALAQDTCNGRSEYCTRSYSNITFVGSHDSAFVGDLPTQNQNLDINDQLGLGIRYLQAQTHKAIGSDSTIELCHTSCVLEDAGTLSDYLSTIKTWLDGNANEVLTLLLTNGDSLDISVFGDTFSGVDGLVDYIYVPSSQPLAIGDWPTLGDLISSGKRLIVFLDYGANTDTVNYINDEFAYYFETPFDVTDSTFSNCSIDRPAGASADGRMYLVNHYLDKDILGADVPDRDAADTTNAASGDGSISAQASACAGQYNANPNVLLLDFVDKGDPIGAQDALNGLS